MRTRIVALLIAPIACILLTLGAVIAHNFAASTAQQAYLKQLDDVNRFRSDVAAAVASSEVSGMQSELDRYGEVYRIGAAVVKQDGQMWLGNGNITLDEARVGDSVAAALSGKHSEPAGFRWPWDARPLIVSAPVSFRSDVIGAVVTVSDTTALGRAIVWRWSLLALGVALTIAAAVIVADRLARWAIRPVGVLATALAAVGDGQIQARVPPGSGPPELRHLVVAFNDMAARVETAIRNQRAFVANASHELRNPLNALLLQVEELGMTIDDESRPHYEAAREEGLRMARLLDALLMLARGENSEFVTGPVDIAQLALHRVGALRPLAAERGVRLEVAGAESVWADADDVAVELALDAVLDNASKFAPSGSTVTVSAARQADDASLSVRDHGPGMSERELTVATDRFWRSPQHQNQPGSGLGLAIASTFIRVCGGTLEMASPVGGGLVVELRLPARDDEIE
ncbi:sensor histidine kinase [Nakamurella lactea]|uniref:sensor histidine kinase n=1 Tax=Nakamurella lactea TaxID=459515 RepID=UPI00040B4912|nr:HAMP domain-containing sensor histidine kinase [Nakamurella lactea]